MFNKLIKEEQQKTYFKEILKRIDLEQIKTRVFPLRNDWFRAFELTPYENVKVVIIGQDPYHGINQANGLCFSVNRGVKLPKSLVNIYKEIELEYGQFMSDCGDLTPWAKQGVLLLNTILTVSENMPLSHKDFGWQTFTDRVINLLQEKPFIVYILLGAYAQTYVDKITNKNHVILKTSHPSPLSSFRGFMGSNIFKNANKALEKNGIKGINWIL